MAEKKDQGSGVFVQGWVPAELADDLKHAAELQDRSVSSVIRSRRSGGPW